MPCLWSPILHIKRNRNVDKLIQPQYSRWKLVFTKKQQDGNMCYPSIVSKLIKFTTHTWVPSEVLLSLHYRYTPNSHQSDQRMKLVTSKIGDALISKFSVKTAAQHKLTHLPSQTFASFSTAQRHTNRQVSETQAQGLFVQTAIQGQLPHQLLCTCLTQNLCDVLNVNTQWTRCSACHDCATRLEQF